MRRCADSWAGVALADCVSVTADVPRSVMPGTLYGGSLARQSELAGDWLGVSWELLPSAGSCDAVIYCPPNKFMAAAQVEFCHDVSHVVLDSFR